MARRRASRAERHPQHTGQRAGERDGAARTGRRGVEVRDAAQDQEGPSDGTSGGHERVQLPPLLGSEQLEGRRARTAAALDVLGHRGRPRREDYDGDGREGRRGPHESGHLRSVRQVRASRSVRALHGDAKRAARGVPGHGDSHGYERAVGRGRCGQRPLRRTRQHPREGGMASRGGSAVPLDHRLALGPLPPHHHRRRHALRRAPRRRPRGYERHARGAPQAVHRGHVRGGADVLRRLQGHARPASTHAHAVDAGEGEGDRVPVRTRPASQGRVEAHRHRHGVQGLRARRRRDAARAAPGQAHAGAEARATGRGRAEVDHVEGDAEVHAAAPSPLEHRVEPARQGGEHRDQRHPRQRREEPRRGPDVRGRGPVVRDEALGRHQRQLQAQRPPPARSRGHGGRHVVARPRAARRSHDAARARRVRSHPDVLRRGDLRQHQEHPRHERLVDEKRGLRHAEGRGHRRVRAGDPHGERPPAERPDVHRHRQPRECPRLQRRKLRRPVQAHAAPLHHRAGPDPQARHRRGPHQGRGEPVGLPHEVAASEEDAAFRQVRYRPGPLSAAYARFALHVPPRARVRGGCLQQQRPRTPRPD
mmetsp:Transcript_18230/g.31031  ORF Transcript_18230/g.31031 Transcript_18230/m.31031 type:complete len:593 (+) Transcript_18230:175-1953(+)